MTTLDEAFEKRMAQLRDNEEPGPATGYVEEYTVSPTSYSREDKEVLRQRQEEAKGLFGFPSGSRTKELVKEGVATGTAGLLNVVPTMNTLAAQAMAYLLPLEPLKKMAAGASELENYTLSKIEPRVRGVLSGTLGTVANPMVAAPGERIPKMLPPATWHEQVLYRAGEFLPETLTAATAVRAALGQIAPGVAGGLTGIVKAAPSAAGSALGLGGLSLFGEEAGGSIGKLADAEAGGRALGRLVAELGLGTPIQATGKALAFTVKDKLLVPLYKPAITAARRVFDGTALDAMRGDTVAGMDEVQSRLDQFFSSQEGERLRQALAGRQKVSEDVARAAEKAMADAGLPLTIDLATRSGADEMRNLVQTLERKSQAMRARKDTQAMRMAEAEDVLFNQASAANRQANLHLLSRDMLDQIERRQDTKVAQIEQEMTDLVQQVQEGGQTFESVGRRMRELLTQERNSMRQKFQVVYQRLDNDGNTFSAQLPGGGYRLDKILRYLEKVRTEEPELFNRVHGAITRYDRQANRHLLKEDPTTSADNMPDAGEFPEIMSDDEIFDPAVAQADAAIKVRRDAESYKGLQEYPAGRIGVDTSKYKPVSFQTLRFLRRDAGFALRSSPPELRKPLLELQRLIDAELAENTPELFDAFKVVQEKYATDYIGKFQRGVTGKVLASNREGVMTMLDNRLLSAFFDAGAQGALEARKLGIDQMQPNPLLTIALRKLATSIGKADPVNSAETFKAFVTNNKEFLDAAGLTPIFERSSTAMSALNETLSLARQEKKMLDKDILTRIIKSAEIQIGNKEDVGDILRSMIANPETRESLTRMMASPGNEAFRDSVLNAVLESLRSPKSTKPFEEMQQLERVLRPLYETKSPDAFEKALSFAAVVQARRMVPPTGYPQGTQSLAGQDPMAEAIGTSTVGLLSRARGVALGFMSKIYAFFDVSARYGVKISRERADQLLMDAIYDPDAANRLLQLSFDVTRPGVSRKGIGSAFKKWNQYAIENGLAVLLFETTERSPTPEPLPRVD